MTPVDLARRTRAIGAPIDWEPETHGECGVLPVRDEVDERGFAIMCSAWLPSAEELRLLNLGLPVMLRVYGNVHPVVSLGVGEFADLVVTNKVPVHA